MLLNKFLIIASLSIIPFFANAELVTSTVENGIIKQIPEAGQIVKKGEQLVVFSDKGINAAIACQKIKIEMCKEKYKVKSYDMERAMSLSKTNSISKDEAEEISFDCTYAKLDIDENNEELVKLECDKEHTIIVSPYDCKVTRVILALNSGTDVGQEILEIEKLK